MLNRGKLIYQSDFGKMLCETAALGIPTVIASGRTLLSLKKIFSPYFEKLIFFSLDGAYISAGNVKIADHPIAVDVLEDIVKNSQSFRGIEFCTEDKSYLMSKSSFLHESEKARLADEYSFTEKIPNGKVYKVIIFTKQGERPNISGLNRVYENDRVCEFIRSGVDKSTAARLLCTELKIDPCDVMAFGDGENDRTLLNFSGQPVTVYGSKHDIFVLSDKHTANVAEYIRYSIKQLKGKEKTFNG